MDERFEICSGSKILGTLDEVMFWQFEGGLPQPCRSQFVVHAHQLVRSRISIRMPGQTG